MARLKVIICFFCFFSLQGFSVEENFLLIDGSTNEEVVVLGPHMDEQVSPCSTFKIPLSLMGYDVGVLQDEENPTWDFQEGYDDFLETWKTPQSLQSWMKYSCVWYSKVLSLHLGLETIQNYLVSLEYGNHDMSGGLANPGPTDPAWINSSLKISPREQAAFIQKMVGGQLPLSNNSVQMTKVLLFKEELPEGWKLFGKTGWSGSIGRHDDKILELGWFVGWIEKGQRFFPFAYLIREKKINLERRIPRVKELLVDSQVMNR